MKKLFKRYQRFIRYTSTTATSVDQSLNRTFMELKSGRQGTDEGMVHGLNRTFMELKRGSP